MDDDMRAVLRQQQRRRCAPMRRAESVSEGDLPGQRLRCSDSCQLSDQCWGNL